MKSTHIPPRLRWSCRRGMLELDVLLGNFLEEVFLALSAEEQAIFTELLEVTDQDLFMWLTGKEIPQKNVFASMITKIRQHAQSRHSN